jgi:hypothetical protein
LKDLSSLPTLKEFQELDADENTMVEELPERESGESGPLQEEASEALDAADAAQADDEGSADKTVTSEASRQG